MAKKTVAVKKRKVHVGAVGQIHIHSSFNNIIVSMANEDGQVIAKIDIKTLEVEYLDEDAKTDPYAQDIIAEAIEMLKANGY